jgi:hypothetical protein
MFYRKQSITQRLTYLLTAGAMFVGMTVSAACAQQVTPAPAPGANQGGNQGGATANPQPLRQGGQQDLLNRNNSHPFFNPANIRQDYTYADLNNAPFVTKEVHPEGHDVVVDRKSQGPGEITLNDVYKWPVVIPTATSPLPTLRDEGIGDHLLKTWGYPVSDTQYQMIHRYNQNIMLAEMFDPERVMWTLGAMGNMQMQNTADSAANLERNQAASAIDFTASYLYNFTVEQGNRWNRIRDQLFIPMAILILLPGAVLAQVKAIVAAGTPVIQDVSSPFEGILRSIVAIFLIPATYLVINYGIDVANSITYTIQSEYRRIFGSDMYKDALCLHVRAFPIRMAHENDNGIFRPPTMWTQLDPKGPKNQTPAAVMEGQTTSNMLEDPCANTRIVPPERTNEAAPFLSTTERAMMGISNAGLAATWNILCAFQMAYLYYLWCVGPVVAALWVWPSKQLREALPSWTEGVVTLCFWSLFWNTVVLLMACFRGVDDTGSVITAALLFLSNAAVKHAFDFAGLVKAAGQAAAGQALGQAGKMGQSAGAGVGASKGSSPSAAAAHAPSGSHASAAPHPAISHGSTSGASVGSSHSGAGTGAHMNPFAAAAGHMQGGGYGYSGSEGGADMGAGGIFSPGSFSSTAFDTGGAGFNANAGFVPPPVSGFGGADGAAPAGFFGAADADMAAAAAAGATFGGASYSHSADGGGGGTPGSISLGDFNSSLHSPGYHAFSNAAHAAFNNHHMNAMHALHALHANFGAGIGGHHEHGHGVTPPGMNSKEAATHMLALHAAHQHMNDLKLHAPNIDMSASHSFSNSFTNTLGGLDASYNSLNQQMMALAAANPQQFSQFTNSDGTLDYAQMANSADIIDFDQLNVSDTDYNNMATDFSSVNAATSEAETMARDLQSSAMQQALGQQQAQVQQQVQAEQNRLMQDMLAGTAPGQQQSMQQAMQQAQQQQQQDIQQLLARQAQDSMQVAQQLQQQFRDSMQGPNAQGASNDPAVQQRLQQQAQQQAQQAWQQHVSEQQAVVQQAMQIMQQQQMHQALPQNPALQQMIDQSQQNIAQAVQSASMQQQQAVAQELNSQMLRAAQDAGAAVAGVAAVGVTGAGVAAGISTVQGNLLSTSNMPGTSADGQYYRTADGLTWKNDATASIAPLPAPVCSQDGVARTADGVTNSTLYVPVHGDSSQVQAGSQGAGYTQTAQNAGAAAADIVSSITGSGPSGSGSGFTEHLVDGAGNLFTAHHDSEGNLFYVGQNGEKIVPQVAADGTKTFYNPETQQVASLGSSVEARLNAENAVLSRSAGAQAEAAAAHVNAVSREVSAAATAAGAALGMSSLIASSGHGIAPTVQYTQEMRIQERQLSRNSFSCVDTFGAGVAPSAMQRDTGNPGVQGSPSGTPNRGRFTSTTSGKHVAMRGGPAMGMPGRAGRVTGAGPSAMLGQPGAGGPGSAMTRALGKGLQGPGGRPTASGTPGPVPAGSPGNADLARKSVSDPFGEVHLSSLRNRSRTRDKKGEQDDLEEFGDNMKWEF